jgi:hypothetical protein
MVIIQSLLPLLLSITTIPYDDQSNKWLFDPQMIVSRNEKIIRFQTRSNGIYIMENANDPISKHQSIKIDDQPNMSPGMPGRD